MIRYKATIGPEPITGLPVLSTVSEAPQRTSKQVHNPADISSMGLLLKALGFLQHEFQVRIGHWVHSITKRTSSILVICINPIDAVRPQDPHLTIERIQNILSDLLGFPEHYAHEKSRSLGTEASAFCL